MPALAISATTVNVGNAVGGFTGNVILSGATALTGASAHGQRQCRHTQGQQRAYRRLRAQPAGQLRGHAFRRLRRLDPGPRERQYGRHVRARCQPGLERRCSPASSLTIAASSVFQWVYNSPNAKGTIATGSNTLNLPASGNPIFEPQFALPPAVGTYVMTWSSSPANTAHLELQYVADCARAACRLGHRQQHLGYRAELELSAGDGGEPQLHGRRPAIECADLRQHAGHGLARLRPRRRQRVDCSAIGREYRGQRANSQSVTISSLQITGTNGMTASLALTSNASITATKRERARGRIAGRRPAAAAASCPRRRWRSAGAASLWATPRRFVGAATMNNNGGLLTVTGGSVTTLSTSAGLASFGASAGLGSAIVSGGTLNTVNAHLSILDVSAGVGSVPATSPITISNTLKLPGRRACH